MRFVTYADNDGDRVGVLDRDHVYALPPGTRLIDLLHDQERLLETGERALRPDQWYAAPAFYFTNPYAVHGPCDDVWLPPGCTLFDFELEVAAVIGRGGRDSAVAEAESHIAGYVLMNDWSVRTVDILGFGTCGGCLAELWGRQGFDSHPPLSPGDTVTLSVEHLGSQTSRILPAAPSPHDDVSATAADRSDL